MPHITSKTISIISATALALGTAVPAFAIDVPVPGGQSGSGATTLKLLTDTSEYGGTEQETGDYANPDVNGDGLGDNLAFTVPSALTFVVKANGDLMCPSSTAAYIQNETAYGIHVSSVEVDAENTWNLVADASSTGVTTSNAVSMNVGPATDSSEKISLASYTTKTALTNGLSKWGMSAKGATADELNLAIDGKAKNLTATLSSATDFATIHWYLSAGGTGTEYVSPDAILDTNVNIYDEFDNTLVKTTTVRQLMLDSAAIASDSEWADHADKSGDYASPNRETTAGEYAYYMRADYSFVFADDPQATADGTTTPTSANGSTSAMKYRIIGLNHTNGEGITFMAKNALNQGYWMNTTRTNDGGWASENCALRAALNDENLTFGTPAACLPPSVVAAAKPLTKTSNGGSVNDSVENSDFSYSNTSTDKFWLLSTYELFGSEATNRAVDVNVNKQYEFFRIMGVSYDWDTQNGLCSFMHDMNQTSSGDFPVRNADATGIDSYDWWLRSADASFTRNFETDYYTGFPMYVSANTASGVVPCFCL